ncbi:MAG: hypothetical protein SFV52_03905 [Saprospiraceae bacterium]|nr:hypothetical protein [Saprospiraceae bacterium]
MLQNGICFRLHDFQQRITHLKETGKIQEAEEQQLEIRRYNRYVIDLFRTHFNFCPVYFFYSSQTARLQAGEPVLLNENLEPDPSIPLPPVRIIMDYNTRDIGESAFASERFFVLNSQIEVKGVFFTSDRLKARGDSIATVKGSPLPFRWDRSELVAADVKRLNDVLLKH